MQDQLIAVIDDDEALRRSMDSLLTRAGFDVKTFESGDNFLACGSGHPFSCIILDMQMPGRDGLAVLRALGGRAESPPVIVLTGHGDIAVAVRAMKLGADNFIEKPVAADALLAAIENAFSRARARARPGAPGPSSEAAALVAALTDRQRQVLRGILRGKQNKIIAFELGLSIRTIEAYRSQLLSKLGVRGTADAVRLALMAGLGEEAPAGPPAPRPSRAAARPPTPDGPYIGFRAHR
jgi:two-component system response regulator FixJ